jgi:hypothetical protein
MKDTLGHGSDARGGSGPRPLSAHQAARRMVQLHPNQINAEAENTLRRVGYSENDITRLKQNAGAQVADLPAHQTGVVAATSKDLTRRMIAPVDIDRLRNMRDQLAAEKVARR